jgi:carbon storage regulator
MLVIRRKAAESLLIGDDIEIEILEIANGQVKIGITAPREIPVVRSEIRVTQSQNEQAAAISSAVLDQLLLNLREARPQSKIVA